MFFLQTTRRKIIEYAVTENIIFCIFPRYVFSRLTDNNRKFHLIVNCTVNIETCLYFFIAAQYFYRPFTKVNGIIRFLLKTVHSVLCFLQMRTVIHADT